MHDEEPSLPESAAASGRRPGIGETLRSTREFRRASIEYVAELLRIEPRFLVALEEERFDAIGPPVFVKGYVKHYCELLGIEPGPLLDELRERLRSEEPPLQARRPAERGGERSGLPVVGAAVLVVALAAAVTWELVGIPWQGDDVAETAAEGLTETEAPAPDPEPPAPDPEAPFPVEPDGPMSVRQEALELPAPESPIETPSSGEPREPSEEARSDTGDEATLPAAAPEPAVAEVSSAAAETAGAEGLRAEAPAADPADSVGVEARLEIELRFVEDSWTEVTAEDGERLFYGLARAGAEERIRTDGNVRVLLGNADGVVMRVNGEPFAYPAGSRRGELARFRLSAENY